MIVGSAVLLVLAVGGIVAALSASMDSAQNSLVERTFAPAPQFSLAALLQPSRTVSLSDLRGKDTVLNFWQSSCVPCRTEMPLLQSTDKAEHGKIVFVGIDTTDTRASAIAFLESVHVSYLTLFDPDGKVATEYGLYGTPTTVFISAGGKIEGRHIGQLDAPTLHAALQEAFGKLASV